MKQVIILASLLAGLVLCGTVGIHMVTGRPWLESAFLAVITLTTVGSRDVARPGHPEDMLMVMVFLLLGLSVFTYGAFQLGQALVNAQIHKVLERRRMQRAIENLENHIIVCGLGRMGLAICEYLEERKQPFVVIDLEEQLLDEAVRTRGWHYLSGDASDEEVLESAGIANARALASVLPTDADNVYVALTARMMRSEMQIIVRASDERAVKKLQRAGATRVVSPTSSGAMKIARFMMNPSIEDFLEITDRRSGELELADVHIQESSPYVGKALKDTDLRDQGVMVIGIRRHSGERLLPPPGDAIIEPGDSLFAFGSSDAVSRLALDGGELGL